MTAEENLLRTHLDGVLFCSGLDRGRWGYPNGEPRIEWPYCTLWVQADERFVVLRQVSLRFDLTGYPCSAPNAIPWDTENNQPLPADRWPKGPGNVSKVFNPGWKQSALYAPCDRVAMINHDPWKTAHPQWWWTADKEITQYLEFVHRCLNPRDYEI